MVKICRDWFWVLGLGFRVIKTDNTAYQALVLVWLWCGNMIIKRFDSHTDGHSGFYKLLTMNLNKNPTLWLPPSCPEENISYVILLSLHIRTVQYRIVYYTIMYFTLCIFCIFELISYWWNQLIHSLHCQSWITVQYYIVLFIGTVQFTICIIVHYQRKVSGL